jgi:glycerophosphoryl diester phosphodiesterase
VTLLYAHRGAAAERPENTMISFERALELGAGALEFDVHGTRDGELVVSHDPDGRRMCGVGAAFRDSSFAEVQTWDAGHGFRAPGGGRPFAGKGVRVPRFEDVVTAFPKVPLNVDLKAPVAELAVKMLRRVGAEGRVCLASFQRATMWKVRSLDYAGPTALASWEVAQVLALPAFAQQGVLRPRATAAQLPISLGRAWVIARCHALGMRVDYWTVNDPALALKLIALGADGIMTDDPARLVPALRGK